MTPTSERTELLRDDEREWTLPELSRPALAAVVGSPRYDAVHKQLANALLASEREKRQFAAQELRESAKFFQERMKHPQLGPTQFATLQYAVSILNERSGELEAE